MSSVDKSEPYAARAFKKPALSIMFANIQKLTKNKRDSIKADFGYMSCDIILLSECGTQKDECVKNFQIEGYQIINATGNRKILSKNGQVCYWRTDSSANGIIDFVAHNANPITHNYNEGYNYQQLTSRLDDNRNAEIPSVVHEKTLVEISMHCYTQTATQRKIHLIQIYNHPEGSEDKRMDNLIKEFEKFSIRNLNNKNPHYPMIMFGDFNIDFNTKKYRDRWDDYFGANFGLVPTLTNTCTRPIVKEMNDPTKQRQLDWVFTTKSLDDQETLPYSTWFSDHLPLYTAVNKI